MILRELELFTILQMASAKIILQQELLDNRGRTIDLANLLSVDYGRDTIAVIYEGLRDRKIDPNRLMATVLSNRDNKYYGQVLGMSLRAGANPNININNLHHIFLLAVWNIRDESILQDYYFIMLVRGMNLSQRVSPITAKRINLNGVTTDPRISLSKYLTAVGKNYGSIENMIATNPRMSSRVGIVSGVMMVSSNSSILNSSTGLRLIVPGYYESKDIIANHLPNAFTPPDIRIAWVSYNLYASIVYTNYRVFTDTLAKEPEIMYTTANDILLRMKKVGIENVYLIQVYMRMLKGLEQRGYVLDSWQLAMLTDITKRSTPNCSNIAEEFPLDFNKLVVGLDSDQRRILNTICEYSDSRKRYEYNEYSDSSTRGDVARTTGENLNCGDPNSTIYYEDGKRYCFSSTQLSSLIRTGINPETNRPLDPSFVARLRNRAGATSTSLSQDPIVNRFIYHSGVVLDDKSPDQLEGIVRSIFGTGNLRLLVPEHARVTAAWIGNWAYIHDPTKFEQYRRQLGYVYSSYDNNYQFTRPHQLSQSQLDRLGPVNRVQPIQTNPINQQNLVGQTNLNQPIQTNPINQQNLANPINQQNLANQVGRIQQNLVGQINPVQTNLNPVRQPYAL